MSRGTMTRARSRPGRRSGAPQRNTLSFDSRRIVRSTRQPSRKVFRFVVPWIRSASKLGTSVTRSPAAGDAHVDQRLDLEAGQSSEMKGRQRAQKAL